MNRKKYNCRYSYSGCDYCMAAGECSVDPESDLCDWCLEDTIEAGRDEYRMAWMEYVGEFE